MLPPKAVTGDAKATNIHSDVDTVTLSTEPCYYCKKVKCVCDGTPFKKSTHRSETQQREQGTPDAQSPSEKAATQSEDDNPHTQNDTRSRAVLCLKSIPACANGPGPVPESPILQKMGPGFVLSVGIN